MGERGVVRLQCEGGWSGDDVHASYLCTQVPRGPVTNPSLYTLFTLSNITISETYSSFTVLSDVQPIMAFNRRGLVPHEASFRLTSSGNNII